jgi:uncharacterized membrane protein (DUF4010 family)
MQTGNQAIWSIAIAALGGAAIGVERQWSGHAGRAHFGGVRTFTLLGTLAGIAGWLWSGQWYAFGAILLAGGVALAVAGYLAASRHDIDGTSEAAALIVLAAGTLSGLGYWGLCSGTVAITALLLIEKSHLHALVARLPEQGLRAAFRFAVMALIVLPLLPEGPFGPFGGIRPRELWILVLFFSGLSFAGYAARMIGGPDQGYALAGSLGGLVSSTSVTLTFSRNSRSEPAAARALALGVITACTIMYFRVVAACWILYPPAALPVTKLLGAPAILGVAMSVAALRLGRGLGSVPEPPSNPLQAGSALQMALMFQAVLFITRVVRERWGGAGLTISAAVLGLTDVDALTLSMTKAAEDGTALETAAAAIATGVLSNTILKFGLAMALGGREFRKWAAPGIAVLLASSAASLWLERLE